MADNGVGKPDGVLRNRKPVGTGIVKALAHELNANVETLSGIDGTTVSVTHATFVTTVPAPRKERQACPLMRA